MIECVGDGDCINIFGSFYSISIQIQKNFIIL